MQLHGPKQRILVDADTVVVVTATGIEFEP